MEAWRWFAARWAIAGLALAALGANRPYTTVRSTNFLVSAPTAALAEEICRAAEQYRRDLAVEWLGRELPAWGSPCPIRADVSSQLGAGGATSFVFQRGVPTQWTMQIQGSRERILDSVLPHEITHTIFATHFGRPLPRWADEGACTTVEHPSERARQDRFLIEFLTTERGIPFNRMFAMKEYPRDILPLYSQGYSLARFLIQQGGKQKFVQYIGEGMQTNNWTAATQKFYGFGSLSDLQVTWLEWVRQGSPPLVPASGVPVQLAAGSAKAVPPATQVAQTLSATSRTAAPPASAYQASAYQASPAAAAAPQAAGLAQVRPMAGTQLANLAEPTRVRTSDGPLESWQTIGSQNARLFAQAAQFQVPPQPATRLQSPAASSAADSPLASSSPLTSSSQGDVNSTARPVSDGWYARRRDQAQAALKALPAREALPASAEPQPSSSPIPSRPGVLLEWSRPADQPYRPAEDLTGVVQRDATPLWR
jgi:hypothetical protein